MEVDMPFGAETKRLTIGLPEENVVVALSKNPTTNRTWADVVGEVIRTPIDVLPLRMEDLRGKRVAIITDDWARPTPAHEVIPLILAELETTGVAARDITFITASGMHDPLSAADLARKLGEDVVARYRCISHDAGDWDSLVFYGVSAQGTPVWINRYVAEADFKIALGRICLHEAYGYEGGYKMILPGVAGYDTIARDHSFNFSPDCFPGHHENPSRREADAVGRMVGIDFLINVVVNAKGQPLAAFVGDPDTVHRLGRGYGDREVWGAPTWGKADVVVASPGSGPVPKGAHDAETLYRASMAAKEGGVIIGVSADDGTFVPEEAWGSPDELLCSMGQDEFNAALPALALEELLRLHEKRDWMLDEREVQWRIKAVRGEFYRRRRNREIAKRTTILTPDPDAALRLVLASLGPEARVVVLPEARTTLPL